MKIVLLHFLQTYFLIRSFSHPDHFLHLQCSPAPGDQDSRWEAEVWPQQFSQLGLCFLICKARGLAITQALLLSGNTSTLLIRIRKYFASDLRWQSEHIYLFPCSPEISLKLKCTRIKRNKPITRKKWDEWRQGWQVRKFSKFLEDIKWMGYVDLQVIIL